LERNTKGETGKTIENQSEKSSLEETKSSNTKGKNTRGSERTIQKLEVKDG